MRIVSSNCAERLPSLHTDKQTNNNKGMRNDTTSKSFDHYVIHGYSITYFVTTVQSSSNILHFCDPSHNAGSIVKVIPACITGGREFSTERENNQEDQ